MGERFNNWHTYHERTKDRPFRESLREGLSLVSARDIALDLGAGALTDTKHLLQSGFKKVVAVDSEPSVRDRSQEIGDDRLEVVVKRFEDFDFTPNTYDFVNAQFALPFIHPDSFNQVFEKLKNSLKADGILVGQLFGDRDGWKDDPNLTFHTSDEVRELLADLEVINLREEERDKSTAAGTPKHWHVFHIITRK